MKSKRIVLPLVSLLSIVLLASCATETSSTSATSSATSTTTAPETTTEQPSSTTADTTTTPPSSTTTTTTTDTPSSPTTTPTEPSTPIAVEWEVKLVPVTGVTLTLDRPDGKYEEGEIVTITARVTDEGKIFEGFESEQVDDNQRPFHARIFALNLLRCHSISLSARQKRPIVPSDCRRFRR